MASTPQLPQYVLSQIKFWNYKSFTKDSGGVTVDLAPLTLFYGYNHAGKSALVRGIGLWAESIKSGLHNPAVYLNLEFPALLGASFEDLMTSGLGAPIECEMTFSAQEQTLKPVTFKWKIRKFATNEVVLESLVITTDDLPPLLLDCSPSDSSVALVEMEEERFVLIGDFSQLIPVWKSPSSSHSMNWSLWQERLDSNFYHPVEWLSSNRNANSRIIRSRFLRPIGPNGEGFEQWLIHDSRGTTPKGTLQATSHWLEKYLGLSLQVRSQGSSSYELLCSQTSSLQPGINLVDSGQGVQEILPILTLLNIPRSQPTILTIEEPESHLHSNLHAGLGEAFSDFVRINPSSRLMIETHSENLLLSLQLQIAEGNLRPADVVVYWVRRSDEGFSTADKVTFDKLGRPQGRWPRGVFSEDANQARRLLELQKSKSNME